MTRATGRALAALVGALVLVGLAATPAAADPPRPTNYRSTVTEVDPPLPTGVEVRVVGGDSLLELTVPAGHTAVVADYPAGGDETSDVPYLRFDDDGTVRRNTRAVATTANDSRYGTTDRTPDPDAEPEWETVATDGTYAWHDHRIHWMSPTAPRSVAADGQVDLGGPGGTWAVPIEVDGTPTTVTGTLALEPAPGPFVPTILVSFTIVGVGALCRRYGLRAGAAIGAIVGVAAVAVAWATWQTVPLGAGGSLTPVGVAAVGALAGIVAALGPDRSRLVATAANAAALLGWGLVRFAVIDHAVLPTALNPWVDRTTTIVAIGTGLSLAVALVINPRPTRPPQEPVATASPTA